jgi:hypothetical protein
MRDNWSAQRDYELYVRDTKGKEAPFATSGRQLRSGPIGGSGDDLTLGPGEKHITTEDLSSIYDISLPGTYTIQVCRQVYDWGNVYSNRIMVPFVLPPAEAK